MLKVFTLFLIISMVAIKASTSDEKDYTTVSNDLETTLYPSDQNDDEDYLRAIAVDSLNSQTNDTRINGGVTVQQIVPYQVSLQAYRRNNWFHFCGGSIISPNHVLTAAHCVHQMQPHEIHVVAGTLTWKRGGDRHRVLSKRQHPQFAMSPKIVYDVAILKVSPPFNLHKSTVGTISLGSATRVGEKVSVQLTGWGATTPTPAGGVAENLQQLNYQTLSNAECARKGFRVTNGEICALDGRGRGSCVGDSGGPLVTTQRPAQLVGIVSYGTVPCAQGRPDVYSRVSTLLPYINRVVSSEMPYRHKN